MVRIEDIAIAAIGGNALAARSLSQEWLETTECIAFVPEPTSTDPVVNAVAAGLAELFAQRRGESGPAWAAKVGPLSEPLFLVRHSVSMPRLRRLCESESPEPLRRRRIFVPPNYLHAA